MLKTAAMIVTAAAAAAAHADVVQHFTNDQGAYQRAVGTHDLFIDFETNARGQVHGGVTDARLDGSFFSQDVTYFGGDTAALKIAHIGQGIDHEIGPSDNWSGTLRWEYSNLYAATSFTGIDVEADQRISFFRADEVVASTLVGGTEDVFQFFGFAVAGGFDAVELQGEFFAIDAHGSTLVPTPASAACLSALGIVMATRRRRVTHA